MAVASTELAWSLQIGSGFFWSLTYLLIIRRGFLDRTYGMPLVALGANLSWEFIFAFLYPHAPPQGLINIVWFLLDLVILYQAVRFGKADFYRNLPVRLFYPTLLLILVLSFGGVWAITYEFQDWIGKYAAFSQNFLMSVLFVSLLLRRNSVSGQSIYIALFKLIGTVLPSILFFMYFPESVLLTYLYVSIFIFDLIYVLLLYRKHREQGINPWTRF